MTAQELQQRSEKAQELRAFRLDDDEFFVESSEGKVCYRVSLADEVESCSCGDFATRSKKDPEFKCKHILAVINGNGNIVDSGLLELDKPKLDERFIKNIQGRDFVVYAGVLDLAHQKGLQKLEVEAVQYPTEANGLEAICKAVVESIEGESFVEWGDANPKNVNPKVVKHILRMAATRAKARALRDFTNIGMTCLEEIDDLDDVIGDEKSGNGTPRKSYVAKSSSERTEKRPEKDASGGKPVVPPEKKAADKKASPSGGDSNGDAATTQAPLPKPTVPRGNLPAKISSAQLKAIENLSKRRGITAEELKAMLKEQFGTLVVDALTAAEASSFIRMLQQSA